MSPRMRSFVLSAAVLAIVWPGAAPGQGMSQKYDDLLKRLPDGCNALMMVDVQGLYKSKLGVREQWEKHSVDARGRGIYFPVDATKSVTAANVDLESGAFRWKVGMVTMSGMTPNLNGIAKAEGGYVDQIQNTPVLRTNRDFYLFTFPDGVFGFATPANRQAVDNWIQATIVRPRTTRPKFADRAIFRADRSAQIAIAIDLENAVPPKAAEALVSELDLTKKLKLDPQFMATALASAKSALLSIEITEQVRGELRIEFDKSVDILRPVGKELMLAIFENYGMGLKDMAKWKTEVGGQTITMSGPLTKESGRRILSLVQPPQLDHESYSSRNVAAAPAPAPDADTGPVTPQTVLAASQKYYRSVVDLLDGLKGEKSETNRGMRLWYDRYSRRIDDLPILNVDKDLVDWAGQISAALRAMAGGINYSAKNQSYRLSNSGGYVYYGNGYGFGGGSKAYDQAVIKRQEDATLSVQLDANWQAILNSMADMKRKMVDRYKVEF